MDNTIKNIEDRELSLQDNVELSSLVRDVANEIIQEKRRESSNIIKNFFIKAAALDEEVKRLRSQLTSKEDALVKVKAKIARLRAGDWAVIFENKDHTRPDSENKKEKVEEDQA